MIFKKLEGYSHSKSIVKSLTTFVVLILSLIISGVKADYPGIFNLTILGTASVGFILTYIRDYLKHRWDVKLP